MKLYVCQNLSHCLRPSFVQQFNHITNKHILLPSITRHLSAAQSKITKDTPAALLA